MNNFNLPEDKVNALLQMAAQKLGQDPEQLKQQLQSGQLDNLTKNLDSNSTKQLNSLMNNPKALELMLKSDKIQSLLKGMGNQK